MRGGRPNFPDRFLRGKDNRPGPVQGIGDLRDYHLDSWPRREFLLVKLWYS